MDAKQVPLRELLASVPPDARLVIDDADGKGTRFIPVGRLCQEAAAALADGDNVAPTIPLPAEPIPLNDGRLWLYPDGGIGVGAPTKSKHKPNCALLKIPSRDCDCGAEPVQEPVAWMYTGIKQDGTTHGPHLVWRPEYMDAMSADRGAKATPLYTAPPQRKPLSDLAIADIYTKWDATPGVSMADFARAVEAAHGIKE